MLVAVCDDCVRDRQQVRELIEQYDRAKGIGIKIKEYTSGVELCRDMGRLSDFAIIFIDINMDQTDGLETVRKIKDIYQDLPIVIVTALLSYALEGYRVNAARFLAKENLKTTLPECLDEIINKVNRKNEKITFSFVEGTIALEIQRIIYIETERHKNVFYTANETYGLYKKLSEIEKDLIPYGFVRVHQSFLVNMRYVERISSYVCRLTTGKEISVPKSRYQKVKQEYADYKAAVM